MDTATGKQVLVVAGPTGSGESTITNAIIARFPRFTRLVTATTRPPRSGEEPNVHYYFFTKDEFKAKEVAGEMLETTYHANRDVYYGTYAPDLKAKLDAGRIVIVNPDVVGARYYKEHYHATTVFIAPTSVDALIARIRLRNPEMSEEELALRRDNAEAEIRDEKPFYDYVVVNEDGKLDDAIEAVVEILRKEGYSLDT